MLTLVYGSPNHSIQNNLWAKETSKPNRPLCSVKEVKLWAILHGLRMTWTSGYKRVILSQTALLHSNGWKSLEKRVSYLKPSWLKKD